MYTKEEIIGGTVTHVDGDIYPIILSNRGNDFALLYNGQPYEDNEYTIARLNELIKNKIWFITLPINNYQIY